MLFRTEITISKASFEIKPEDNLLFVGSCFADNIGRRFTDNRFRTVVNPYGVMYNPASILHTIERESRKWESGEQSVPDIAVFTLGTNHVYILKETGEIVDNCMKRPQRLFEEKELSVSECAAYLEKSINVLQRFNPNVKVILTVSPIRYAKYGFHGSQLSKATLLLAVGQLSNVEYFPAYEILNDELRDYRFYAPDMLHPSEQAVEFIYGKFEEMFFTPKTHQFVKEWQPIKSALSHRPFNPDSDEYRRFLAKAMADKEEFERRYNIQVPR